MFAAARLSFVPTSFCTLLSFAVFRIRFYDPQQ